MSDDLLSDISYLVAVQRTERDRCRESRGIRPFFQNVVEMSEFGS